MTDQAQPGQAAIRGYHAHVYFDDASYERARALCESAAGRFGLSMGRMHRGPVGPHPVASCQLAFESALLGEVLGWLVANRDGLTVFAHAESGDELRDHTEHVIWLGESLPLKVEIFSASS